eukprot:CAMPEP_0204193228 /NCGR_PEP_ID=MMETSP0361-20130328/61502_1 /ASSEMBLY_ACC=CAM_ASM_000343 /TAXON_ID=268821 /ORGANISM="Scrippsiella Hangoei, Strain SHTV-5" /LENGTH=98 /DNA_ID=CAMNT_0051154407 /DNA_START=12 /DNA_END=309 /DNA_ORIENTATION=-
MTVSSSDLQVCDAVCQGWHRALPEFVVAARDGTTVAAQTQSMITSSRDLHVCDAASEDWHRALVAIESDVAICKDMAVALQQQGVSLTTDMPDTAKSE